MLSYSIYVNQILNLFESIAYLDNYLEQPRFFKNFKPITKYNAVGSVSALGAGSHVFKSHYFDIFLRNISFKQILFLILIFFFFFGNIFNLKKRLKNIFKYLNNSIFNKYKKKIKFSHVKILSRN